MKKIIITIILAMALISINMVKGDAVALASDGGINLENSLGGDDGGDLENDNTDKPSFPSSNIQSKKVIIQSVTPDRDIIAPGEEFNLTYTIANNTSGKLYNASLKIVGVEGKGTLEGFIPVGTTNEIYIGSIPASSSKEVTITLCSDENIKSGAYNFVTSVMYNQWEKDQEEISKLSGIILKSKLQLELSGVEAFYNGMGGYSIAGSVINSGKVPARNVKVIANINDEELEYTIGSIDGESDGMFELSAPPVTEDTIVPIKVYYEDQSGTKYKTEGNCTLRAVDMEQGNLDVGIAPEIPVEESNRFWDFVKRLFSFRIGV